ncbi:hypothetical protein GF323_06400 [Candidatus Woesearchaeota archaeon]|nr:hypothetical protein [Candidatus Woesearchaeota archaeon]
MAKKTNKKNKANKAKANKNQNFFVALSNPFGLEVDFLENRKLILESMKISQVLKNIRKQKNEEKQRLKKGLRKIYTTLNNIKSIMPAVDIPPEKPIPKKEIDEEKEEAEETEEKRKEEPRHHTELDRIEAELNEVESRLSSIS